MMIGNVLKDYENTRLVHYDSFDASSPNTVAYEDLPQSDVKGVLKCTKRIDGKLYLTFNGKDTHVGVISPTGMGKSSSFFIPQIKVNARRKVKPSMYITDPKGEIYSACAEELEKNGYNVLVMNLRNYRHSDCYNILLPIYQKYKEAMAMSQKVQLVETPAGWRNSFEGIVYENQRELDQAVDMCRRAALDDVDNLVSETVEFCIPVEGTDPYWDLAARDQMRAELFAMLEDSHKSTALYERLIDENTYTFNTFFTIPAGSQGISRFYEGRNRDGKAYSYAANSVLENAENTKKCIISIHHAKLSKFRDSAIRFIMSNNTFEFEDLLKRPTALFIIFRDEVESHYEVISLFMKKLYAFLVEKAEECKQHKLETPFYFMLDEFANIPRWDNFKRNITISASRNIYFAIALQSYSQLDSVYGQAEAQIILQNLNYKIFMGSNDVGTLEQFSRECGKTTRVSPSSALAGNSAELNAVQLETISTIPVSKLSHFEPGECIILEANSGATVWSCLVRYFECPEFSDYEYRNENEYVCRINPYDKKYVFNYRSEKRAKGKYDY